MKKAVTGFWSPFDSSGMGTVEPAFLASNPTFEIFKAGQLIATSQGKNGWDAYHDGLRLWVQCPQDAVQSADYEVRYFSGQGSGNGTQPVVPGPEQPDSGTVVVGAKTLTSVALTNAAFAVDNDPDSYARFSLGPQVPQPQQAASIPTAQRLSGAFQVVSQILPRFLKIAWSTTHKIESIRLKLSDLTNGNAIANLRVQLVGGAAAAFNPFNLLTGGLFGGDAANLLTGGLAGGVPATIFTPLEDDDGTFLVQFVPPVSTTGIVLLPDAGIDPATLATLPANQYPELRVQNIQIDESEDSGGNPTMPLPEVTHSRVGVQNAVLYPWNKAAGPYDDTTAEILEALKEVGITISSKSAKLTGGESVGVLDAWETDRETKVSISIARCSFRAFQLIMGGKLVVTAAAGNVGEKQTWKQGLRDRAPYFRIIADSTNGDGAAKLILCKLKIDGTVNYKLTRDEVTNVEFEAFCLYDKYYEARDGETGAFTDFIFAEDGDTEE